jgi:hypothetical protein
MFWCYVKATGIVVGAPLALLAAAFIWVLCWIRLMDYLDRKHWNQWLVACIGFFGMSSPGIAVIFFSLINQLAHHFCAQ